MISRSDRWDAIVVGAGPAGAATAARLARRGHRILIVDREDFPRRKPCGDCVSPAAMHALSVLGAAERVLREPRGELAGWRIRTPRGSGFEGLFPRGERGIAVARERLDAALLDHAREAGAVVMTGVHVTDLVRTGEAVTGVRGVANGDAWEAGSSLVMGADGLRSVVLRRLGLLRRNPRLRKVALTARLSGVEPLGNVGELHVRSWGCIGVAEIGGGAANVTVVVDAGTLPRLAGSRDEYFDAAVAGLPALRDGSRMDDVLATGPFDWPVRSAVADGAMLVGDAAGYFDPFTGQGIYRALHGAELAAETADHALSTGDVTASALARYDVQRARAFAPGERLQRVIEAFVSRPRLLAAAASGIRRRPRFADALIAVTADLATVRTLADPRHLVRSSR